MICTQYYSAVTFLSDNIITDTSVDILVILNYYFKLDPHWQFDQVMKVLLQES